MDENKDILDKQNGRFHHPVRSKSISPIQLHSIAFAKLDGGRGRSPTDEPYHLAEIRPIRSQRQKGRLHPLGVPDRAKYNVLNRVKKLSRDRHVFLRHAC